MISDQNFDKQLNQALNNLEVPYDPSSWDVLERRIDSGVAAEHPAPVDPVDRAVYHTLERLNAPYQSAHWDILNKQMLRQAVRIRRLRWAKLAEATIFLIFLANFSLFTGRQPARPAPAHWPDVPVASATPGGLVPGASGNATRSGSFARNKRQLWSLAGLDQPAAVGQAPDVLSSDYLMDPNIGSTIDNLRAAAARAGNRIYAAQYPADLLPCDALVQLNIPYRVPDVQKKTIQPFRTPRRAYLGAYATLAQNRVTIDSKKIASGGYGGGIALGARRNKWGVETGVGYIQSSYVPKPQVEIYDWDTNGYYGSTLTEVKADIITVPVKVSRQIARIGKTTAHVVAGITTSIAVQKAYDYGTVFFPNPVPNTQPAPNQAPKLQQSGRGVLEGGKAKGNIYASVDAGVRIEHPVAGGRYTAFVEPGYRQAITNGIGPRRERINSLVFQAGVMATL